VNKINPLIKHNLVSPVKEKKINSENCYYDISKNIDSSCSPSNKHLNNKDDLNSVLGQTQDAIFINNNTDGHTIENSNIGEKLQKNLNNLEHIPINNNKNIHRLNLNENSNSFSQITFNNNKSTNLNSLYYSPNARIIKRNFSTNINEINLGELQKFGNMHNFFRSENLLNNENLKFNPDNNLEKNDSRLCKLNPISNSKKILYRPRTVNGIELNFFNSNINQETYKSVLEVLEMPTTYLPFSKKRSKNSELEKQSYLFKNIVDEGLKDFKKRDARKIKIKSKNELSNYLMRDYFIGEIGDSITSSK